MNLKHSVLALAVLLAACGAPTAPVSPELSADELSSSAETAEAGAELVSSAARLWFPMSEGDSWTFMSRTSTRKLTVDFASGGIRHLTGFTADEDGTWLGYTDGAPNSLYAWGSTAGWAPFLRFGYRYTPWEYKGNGGGCERFELRRSATDIAFPTPAGSFADARTIDLTLIPSPTARCVAPAYASITFAPGVGPVGFTTGAGEVFVLKEASVSGRAFPAALSLRTDKATYVNQPNTIRCITTPCPSNEVTAVANLTLTLTNTSQASRTYRFTSSQQHDFQLLDAAGKVVKTWSMDKLFAQGETSFTLAPGGSRSFTGELSLEAGGQQLKGVYTARGTLTAESGAPAAAVTRFTVVVP